MADSTPVPEVSASEAMTPAEAPDNQNAPTEVEKKTPSPTANTDHENAQHLKASLPPESDSNEATTTAKHTSVPASQLFPDPPVQPNASEHEGVISQKDVDNLDSQAPPTACKHAAEPDETINANTVQGVATLFTNAFPSNFSSETNAPDGVPSTIDDALQDADLSMHDILMPDDVENENIDLDSLLAAWSEPGTLSKPDNGMPEDPFLTEIDDGLAAQEAEEKYLRETKRYERLKNKRKNTTEDDITQLKRERDHKKRKVIEQNAMDESDAPEEVDESLFVPAVSESENDGPVIRDESADEAHKTPKKRNSGKGTKAKPAAAKQNKKGGRGKKSCDDAQSQQPKTKRMTRVQMQRQSNLFTSNPFDSTNVFAAAQTNAGRAEQPSFTSKNKEIAMKELIASIPEQSRSTAKVDSKQLQEASKTFGNAMCKAADGEWLIKGMRSKMTHYQMLGSSFMREREAYDRDSRKFVCNPTGGLQCDAMGLGKTVMSIATIVSDKYQEMKKNRKANKVPTSMATLIVAPASILYQWRDEIRTHAAPEHIGGVMMYSAGSMDDDTFMAQQDIVLTTYSQVQKSYPKKNYPVEVTTSEAKEQWWRDHFNANKGSLHSVKWRRIILDEATAIKNFRSQTSAACTELQGQFRWVITGTPAMNCLDEFYSYFRFLRAPHCDSFKLFKKNLVDGDDSKERLVAFLRPLMLRRTHDSTLMGSKLLNLPTPTKDTFPVPLDELHYEVYRIVKERFVEHINIIARKGELPNRYSNVLTLLLRLRQFVAHPLLIQDSIRDLLEDSDFAKISEKLDEAEKNRDDGDNHQFYIVQHMRRMLASRDELIELEHLSPGCKSPKPSQATSKSNDASEGQASSDASALPGSSVGASFGLHDDFRKFLTELRAQGKTREVNERITCARCKKLPTRPILTSCRHTYCNDCLQADSRDAVEQKLPLNICKRCGVEYTGKERYELPSGHSGESTMQAAVAGGAQLGTSMMPRKQKAQDVINTWIDGNGNMLPSAKTQAFKAQVLNWLKENKDVKIIVYTQFVTMMRILARICELESWSFVLYHGGLSAATRAATVHKFATEPVTIFFATLTTGGVGLNLTMATRVIMVDPWWNHAVEQQAFCRTYRRGQNQKTSMTRFAARGTVDEHILQLQERKLREITTVMNEENADRRLGIGDLLRLFGPLREDEERNPFIFTADRDGAGKGGRRAPTRWVDRRGDEEDGATDP